MQSEFVTVTRDNIGSFAGLYASVFNSPPWKDGWAELAVSERFESFSKFPTFRGLGYLVAGVPGGLVFGWSERWVQGWHFNLKEMCVATHLQGQHVGTRMLAVLEKRLAAEGIDQVFLQTGQSVPAKRFYEKLGYKELSLVSLAKKIDA